MPSPAGPQTSAPSTAPNPKLNLSQCKSPVTLFIDMHHFAPMEDCMTPMKSARPEIAEGAAVILPPRDSLQEQRRVTSEKCLRAGFYGIRLRQFSG